MMTELGSIVPHPNLVGIIYPFQLRSTAMTNCHLAGFVG